MTELTLPVHIEELNKIIIAVNQSGEAPPPELIYNVLTGRFSTQSPDTLKLRGGDIVIDDFLYDEGVFTPEDEDWVRDELIMPAISKK